MSLNLFVRFTVADKKENSRGVFDSGNEMSFFMVSIAYIVL